MTPDPEATRGAPAPPARAAGSDVVHSPARSLARPATPLQPQRDRDGTLTHVIETLLDKGLVINADITVSLAGVELLGVRIRAAIASFDTAARYGLDFPSGTNRSTAAWNDALERKETCPQCGKQATADQLLHEFCPWCGWRSALALSRNGTDHGADVGGDDGADASSDDGADAGTEDKGHNPKAGG